MKLTKSEKCAIIITLAFLCLVLGFTLGQKKQQGSFVMAESSFSAISETEPEESVIPAAQIQKVNINTASAAELETLKGIGPVLAQRITEYRESAGGFKSIEDITKVRGIGAAVFEDIRNSICVD